MVHYADIQIFQLWRMNIPKFSISKIMFQFDPPEVQVIWVYEKHTFKHLIKFYMHNIFVYKYLIFAKILIYFKPNFNISLEQNRRNPLYVHQIFPSF